MFNPTTERLWAEIQEAEKTRDEHLNGINRIIREYVGRWYRGSKDWWTGSAGRDDSEINPEPYSYSFVSNILPSLVYDNPGVIVHARRVIGHQMVQQAIQSGLRSWVEDVDYRKECERVVLDFLFFQGVMLHFIEDDERWSDGAVRPQIKRIDYKTFAVDPLGSCYEDAEYAFHSWYCDLDDLKADPAAIPEAIADLQGYSSEAEVKNEPFGKPDRAALSRNQVCLYSVWLRRTNTIVVLAKGKTTVEVYPRREWYGPKTGPYVLFQAYPVPGQVYPVSPLVAVQDQVIDLNTHARSASRSAAGRKTVFIVDGTYANLAEDIKDSDDREVIAIPGFSANSVQEINLGGVHKDQYEYLGFLRNRLDRHSGMTEAARGNTGSDTATEASIANDALNNRTEYLKSKVRIGVGASLKTVGWFLFHTTGIIIPVSMRDPMTNMETEGLFFGGPIPGQDAGNWNDYSIRIEAMQRVSEQTVQRRTMDFANFIMQTAPLLPQLPYVRWNDIYKMVGDAMSQDNAENFIMWELLGFMGPQPMQAPSKVMPGQPAAQRYFSMPGMGFKMPMNQSQDPGVMEQKQESGSIAGKIGGGMQGPPGSAAQGALVPTKRAF